MSQKNLILIASTAIGALGAPGSGAAPDSAPPVSIVRVALGAEDNERQPVALPTEPENTIEIDFPWPVEDWAGRGFTPDAERYAGDFVIEATRGKPRIFVTPVATGAHRVLHVVLTLPSGRARSVSLEFLPAPAGLAWSKVVFSAAAPAAAAVARVSLSATAPRAQLREPGADSEIGLIRTLRLMLNTTEEGAADIARANPALTWASFDAPPRSFGDFTLACRFAIRDSTTDALALCASVANQTARRLVFDPGSWVVRVGERAYPIRTVDFPGELEPGATAPAFLVLARGPDGEPTRLLPDNAFEISVLPSASVNPRPVKRLNLEGFDIR